VDFQRERRVSPIVLFVFEELEDLGGEGLTVSGKVSGVHEENATRLRNVCMDSRGGVFVFGSDGQDWASERNTLFQKGLQKALLLGGHETLDGPSGGASGKRDGIALFRLVLGCWPKTA
jgi:hypothetical protein